MTEYPLATSNWGREETQAITEVVESGQFTMGPRVAEFERQFAAFLGSRYCVMVNSGSSANLVAVAALCHVQEGRLRPGDEVIVPAVSWSTTYFPLHQYGLQLKFVDIDKDTLNYDLDALSTALTDQVRLVVAVNLLGNPNDFDALREIVGDVPFIEDNCESLGAVYGHRQAGTLGLVGTFSFFYSHHITTMEGGMVCTDDEELYHLMLSLRAHGWTRELPMENHVTGRKSDDSFSESFKFVLPGYNLRPLELEAAIGIVQMQKLPDLVEGRRRNAALFQELFGEHPHATIQHELGASSWFGFALTLRDDSPWERHQVAFRLQQLGVAVRPVVGGNFTRNPVIRRMNYSVPSPLVNADRVHDRAFFVGNDGADLTKQIHRLSEVLR